MNKANNTDLKWKELFIEFLKENSIESLKPKVVFKEKSLYSALIKIRQRYEKASKDEQKKMKIFWDCFPDGFIESQRSPKNSSLKTQNNWKTLFNEFIKEFGFENLKHTTVYKEKHLYQKVTKIRDEYEKASEEEKSKIKAFWNCFPENYLEKKNSIKASNIKWKKLFAEFIKKNGVEELRHRLVYKNEKLGRAFTSIVTNYKKASDEERKNMRIFWDCFPDGYLDSLLSKTKTKQN